MAQPSQPPDRSLQTRTFSSTSFLGLLVVVVGGGLPLFQEADGVLQSFVLVLQLLAALVKHFKFLCVSRERENQFPTIERQVISVMKHSLSFTAYLQTALLL